MRCRGGFAEPHGRNPPAIKTYNDYDKMLADPEVEAVIIGIADQFHVEVALKPLQRGKHVLVEKPLGVSVEECEELREGRGYRMYCPNRKYEAL